MRIQTAKRSLPSRSLPSRVKAARMAIAAYVPIAARNRLFMGDRCSTITLPAAPCGAGWGGAAALPVHKIQLQDDAVALELPRQGRERIGSADPGHGRPVQGVAARLFRIHDFV